MPCDGIAPEPDLTIWPTPLQALRSAAPSPSMSNAIRPWNPSPHSKATRPYSMRVARPHLMLRTWVTGEVLAVLRVSAQLVGTVTDALVGVPVSNERSRRRGRSLACVATVISYSSAVPGC
jgi:hypothetical protein